MRKKSSKFYIRKFINKPGHHTVASVLASVRRGGAINFTLSDCDRTINLEFSAYSKTERTNSLYKAQILIDTLIGFKKALEEEFALSPILED